MIRICIVAIALAPVSPLAAQQRVNVQNYIMGVDVPASPALVALGIAPPMRLGSAPKPSSLSVMLVSADSGQQYAAALDVTPYYLFGGGLRTLDSYRKMTVAGRLTRVLTKTIVSIAVAQSSRQRDALDIGIAVRSTLHDPHDPIGSTSLPEDVADAFAAAGVPFPDAESEGLFDRGVELKNIYAAARRSARARKGDAQVSAGWGLHTTSRRGSLANDSLSSTRYTGWLTAQYTFGPRYDLIASGEVVYGSAVSTAASPGLALRRKGVAGDVQFAARYDTRAKAIEPYALLDVRLASRFGAVVWFEADGDAGFDEYQLRAGILARWFAASDRVPE